MLAAGMRDGSEHLRELLFEGFFAHADDGCEVALGLFELFERGAE